MFCTAFLAALASAILAAPENAIVFNLEPTIEFPRNSEGSFMTLKSGEIRFLYTQFYGGAADHSAARLVSIRSTDGGRTWDATPRTVVENSGGANVMSVSLLRLKSGRIALFYLLKCYTAIHFVDRAVLLAYCAGDSKIGGLNRLRIRRIDLDALGSP